MDTIALFRMSTAAKMPTHKSGTNCLFGLLRNISIQPITEWQNKIILFHKNELSLLGEAEYDSACHSRKKTHQRIDSC